MGMAGHGCIASSISLILRAPASRWAVGLRHCSVSQRREQQRGFSTCRPAADSRKIDPPDVRKLAKMAHISVTDEEVCLLHPLQILPSARTASLISSNSRASHAGQGMGTSAGKDCGLVSFHMQIILDTANNVRDFSQALRPRLRRGGLLAGSHSYKQWTLRASRLL